MKTAQVRDDEPEPAAAQLGLEAAELICAAVEAIGRPAPGVSKPTLERQISGGLLEVRVAGDHVVCRYDPATADLPAWDRALREHLGSTTAALVRYQPARTPPAVLVALLAEISRRQWHPAAAATSLAASVDWEREVVEVLIAADSTDEVATTLVALAGDLAVVTTAARLGRRRGLPGA